MIGFLVFLKDKSIHYLEELDRDKDVFSFPVLRWNYSKETNKFEIAEQHTMFTSIQVAFVTYEKYLASPRVSKIVKIDDRKEIMSHILMKELIE